MLSEFEKDTLCDWIWGRISRTEMLILFTRVDGLEQAQTYCKRDSKFEDTPHCSGGECAATPPKCPAGTEQVAGVHTHPMDFNKFSPADYLYSIIHGEEIQCLAWPVQTTVSRPEGDVKQLQNHIKCERLNLEVEKETPKIREVLYQARSEIAAAGVEARLGGDYSELIKKFEGSMNEFYDLARDTGFIRSCRVPEFMGEWERTIERRPVAPPGS